MNNGDGDSPLEALNTTQAGQGHSVLQFTGSACSQRASDLVQKESAVARHPSSVVDRCRDVAAETDRNEPQTVSHGYRGAEGRVLTLRWPPAHRSRRTPSGHICSDTVLPALGSWLSAWWQELFRRHRWRSSFSLRVCRENRREEGRREGSQGGCRICKPVRSSKIC